MAAVGSVCYTAGHLYFIGLVPDYLHALHGNSRRFDKQITKRVTYVSIYKIHLKSPEGDYTKSIRVAARFTGNLF